MNKKLSMFGIEIDAFDMTETIREILLGIDKGKKIVHVGVNSNKIVLMHQQPEIQKIIQSADLVNADGYSMVQACRWLLGKDIERVTGIDTMALLLAEAEKRGDAVYFLGAKEEVLQRMLKKIKNDHPNLQIVGAHHGYIKGEEADVIEEIAACKPQMLFIGITSPYKEEFVYRYKEVLEANLIMGVGGSFDVLSGTISRAPMWMQRNGLEWLHRFAKEPKRLYKRYVNENILFLYLLMKERKKIKKVSVLNEK